MPQLIFLKDTNTAGLLRISERTGYLIDVHFWMKMAAKEVGETPYLGVVGVNPYLLQITLCIDL